jgi:membrane-associated phospholipid phosphatase
MSTNHYNVAPRTLLALAFILVVAGCLAKASGVDPVGLLAVRGDTPSHFAVVAWSCITVLGMTWPALILLVAMDRRLGQVISLLLPTVLLGSLLAHVPKILIASPRPAATPIRDSLHVIGHAFTGPVSMPSGHALTAAAAATLIAVAWTGRHRRVVSCAAFALAALIGYSRLAVGAHWPSDVLVGFGLGVLTVVLALRFERPAAALARRIDSRAGQLSVALLELALAVSFLSARTGYPDGQPMVMAIVALAVLSAAWRGYSILRRREWIRAEPA